MARWILAAGLVTLGLLAAAAPADALGADVCADRTPLGSHCVSVHPTPPLVGEGPSITVPTPLGIFQIIPCI
ncbi:MAG TPA: hypothetical protein VGR28_09960 [Candidatus Thermoplasmatota archaeon]|nr:hypothetical protein [Candidatus Thermoplasmatota archaeon]